jgi:hypothetical protein
MPVHQIAQMSPAAGARQYLTTHELAERLGVSPKAIHRRYSLTGAYFNLRPVKLPNRRLAWPIDSYERLSGVAA